MTDVDALIVCSGYGGLCNRLMPLAVAATAAETRQLPLYVRWTKTSHCPGQLVDGLDPASMPWAVIDDRDLIAVKQRHPAALVVGCPTATTHPQHMAKHLKLPFPVARSYQEVPMPGVDTKLRSLRPAAGVRAKLDALAVLCPPREHRVGVHVRRTDLPPGRFDPAAVDRSLVSRLDKLLDERPESALVTASDNAASLEMLRTRYGSRVVPTGAAFATPLEHRHTSLADAFLDLFALADTSLLIGTQKSTFSATAKRLGDIAMERP